MSIVGKQVQWSERMQKDESISEAISLLGSAALRRMGGRHPRIA
jgi:hypothetical protein